jgi:hypothetical protein
MRTSNPVCHKTKKLEMEEAALRPGDDEGRGTVYTWLLSTCLVSAGTFKKD